MLVDSHAASIDNAQCVLLSHHCNCSRIRQLQVDNITSRINTNRPNDNSESRFAQLSPKIANWLVDRMLDNRSNDRKNRPGNSCIVCKYYYHWPNFCTASHSFHYSIHRTLITSCTCCRCSNTSNVRRPAEKHRTVSRRFHCMLNDNISVVHVDTKRLCDDNYCKIDKYITAAAVNLPQSIHDHRKTAPWNWTHMQLQCFQTIPTAAASICELY